MVDCLAHSFLHSQIPFVKCSAEWNDKQFKSWLASCVIFYSSVEFNVDTRLSLLCLSKTLSSQRQRKAKNKEPGIEVELNFDSPDTRQNTAYLHTWLEFTRVNNHFKINRMHRRLCASVECFLTGTSYPCIFFILFSPQITRQLKSKESSHLKPREDLFQIKILNAIHAIYSPNCQLFNTQQS